MKLSKGELEKRSELADSLRDKAEDVELAIAKFNAAMASAFEHVQKALEAYSNVVSEARDFAEGLASDYRSTFDDRSEKWQESDAGQQALEFIEAWEALSADEVSVDGPSELEAPEMALADELEALPEEG